MDGLLVLGECKESPRHVESCVVSATYCMLIMSKFMKGKVENMAKFQEELIDLASQSEHFKSSGIDIIQWGLDTSKSLYKVFEKDPRIWKYLTPVTPPMADKYYLNEQARKNVADHFRRIIGGEDPIDRTWWFENYSDAELIEKVKDILIRRQDVSEEIIKDEIKRIEKFGPQGGIPKLVDNIGQILDSFEPKNVWVDKLRAEAMAKRVARKIRRGLTRNGVSAPEMVLRPISYEDSYTDMILKDKVAGKAAGLNTGEHKDSAVAYDQAMAMLLDGTYWDINLPALFNSTFRKQKLRMIWLTSLAQVIEEGTWTVPLMDLFRKSGIANFQAWESLDFVGPDLTAFWGEDEIACQFDYDKMDTRTGIDAMYYVWCVLKEFYPEKYHQDLLRSLQKQCTVPLMISEGLILVGAHGTSSGSKWTNFVETIYSMIIIEYILNYTFYPEGTKHSGRSLADAKIKITRVAVNNGDDIIFVLTVPRGANGQISADYQFYFDDGHDKGMFTIAEIFVIVSEKFGEKAKLEKQSVSPYKVAFCQFHYYKDRLARIKYLDHNSVVREKLVYEGIYLLFDTLNSLVYRQWDMAEEWHKSDEIIRTITVLEKSRSHPAFIEFVNFIIETMGKKNGSLGLNFMVTTKGGQKRPFLDRSYLQLVDAQSRDDVYQSSWNHTSEQLGFPNFYTVRYLMARDMGDMTYLTDLEEDQLMYNSQLVYNLFRVCAIEQDLAFEINTLARTAPKRKFSVTNLYTEFEKTLERLRMSGQLIEDWDYENQCPKDVISQQ